MTEADSSRDDERSISLDDLVLQALSTTEVSILSTASELRRRSGLPPTAAEIRRALKKQLGLEKTQLYDLLRRLSLQGFLIVKLLPRPRRYIVNQGTLTSGVANWIESQRKSIIVMSEELRVLSQTLRTGTATMHNLPSHDLSSWEQVSGSPPA